MLEFGHTKRDFTSREHEPQANTGIFKAQPTTAAYHTELSK